MTAVLVIAVWFAVGLVLGLLIGRGIATADRDATRECPEHYGHWLPSGVVDPDPQAHIVTNRST